MGMILRQLQPMMQAENRLVPSEVFPRRAAPCPIIATRLLWVHPAVSILGR